MRCTGMVGGMYEMSLDSMSTFSNKAWDVIETKIIKWEVEYK